MQSELVWGEQSAVCVVERRADLPTVRLPEAMPVGSPARALRTATAAAAVAATAPPTSCCLYIFLCHHVRCRQYVAAAAAVPLLLAVSPPQRARVQTAHVYARAWLPFLGARGPEAIDGPGVVHMRVVRILPGTCSAFRARASSRAPCPRSLHVTRLPPVYHHAAVAPRCGAAAASRQVF